MSEKILIIDDDANLLAGLKRQLRRRFEVHTALCGEEALRMMGSNGHYAVVISDYSMPGMNGIETLQAIRQLSPNTIRMMLTGSADLPTAVQAVNEGYIFQFLLKPCPSETLNKAIDSGIRKFRQRIEEQDRMLQIKASLSQASEIQKSLIPQSNPSIEGYDIAGKTIWCDETGGDYYDFIQSDSQEGSKLTVVVGDVIGHGVPSALLMTTARAFLRERISQGGDTAAIMADVNRQLYRDMNESNRFITLFYSEIEVRRNTLTWARAGHDPALLYDPTEDHFSELEGDGMPLGVLEDVDFEVVRKQLARDQILVIFTDGVWETINAQRTLFGKERLEQIIRENANRSAEEIIAAVMTALDEFRKACEVKDDATLVVIKVCR